MHRDPFAKEVARRRESYELSRAKTRGPERRSGARRQLNGKTRSVVAAVKACSWSRLPK